MRATHAARATAAAATAAEATTNAQEEPRQVVGTKRPAPDDSAEVSEGPKRQKGMPKMNGWKRGWEEDESNADIAAKPLAKKTRTFGTYEYTVKAPKASASKVKRVSSPRCRIWASPANPKRQCTEEELKAKADAYAARSTAERGAGIARAEARLQRRQPSNARAPSTLKRKPIKTPELESQGATKKAKTAENGRVDTAVKSSPSSTPSTAATTTTAATQAKTIVKDGKESRPTAEKKTAAKPSTAEQAKPAGDSQNASELKVGSTIMSQINSPAHDGRGTDIVQNTDGTTQASERDSAESGSSTAATHEARTPNTAASSQDSAEHIGNEKNLPAEQGHRTKPKPYDFKNLCDIQAARKPLPVRKELVYPKKAPSTPRQPSYDSPMRPVPRQVAKKPAESPSRPAGKDFLEEVVATPLEPKSRRAPAAKRADRVPYVQQIFRRRIEPEAAVEPVPVKKPTETTSAAKKRSREEEEEEEPVHKRPKAPVSSPRPV